MVVVADIDVTTLAARLMDRSWRGELWEAIAAEQGSNRPLAQAFSYAVARMEASGEQVRDLVFTFENEQREDALAELLFHPHVPEDLLLQFCERGAFIQTLGHRSGPRGLLARVAELHAYPEAIVSLGLDLFRDPGVLASEFATFARTYRRHEWMLRSLAEVCGSDPAKEAIYEGLLPDFPDAAAYHARHLARSKRFSTERLEAFLDLHADPWILVLLLARELDDHAKRTMVEARAAARVDQPEIAVALGQYVARKRATAPDLDADTAKELFAAGDPEVLLALADNPRTPRDLLEALAQTKGVAHARQIRGRALVTLKRGKGRG